MTDSFVEAPIPAVLRPWVVSMHGYRISGARPGVHVGLPSGAGTLILALDTPLDLVGADGRHDRYDAVLAGVHSGPAHIHHDGYQHGIQVSLTPGGLSQLIGGPSAEVSGTSVDLAALIGPTARRLHEQVGGRPDWGGRFAAIVRTLFADPEPRREPRAEVAQAWRLLEASRGRAAVRDVAREIGWSPRHLGEQFRREFGHTPKTTARVLRFGESHRLVAAGHPLAAAAAQAGYADQSHLNREWLRMAGTSPTRWRRDDELAFVQDGTTPAE